MSIHEDYNPPYPVSVITTSGEYFGETDLNTLKLMMKATMVTVNGKTIKVKGVEVCDSGQVNFYGEDIKQKE